MGSRRYGACEPPAFDLPYIPEIEGATGYTGSRRGSWTASTCIQEIAENGVPDAQRFDVGQA